MNFVSKFDGGLLPFTGTHPKAQTHIDTVHTKAPADAIIVKDADLLFNGDFKRSGADLVISKDGREQVLSDYFKGDKHAPLASSDGAYLTGKIVDALTGHVQVAQAAGGAAAAKIIGHVTKLTGEATVIRNGVSIILNNGDNVHQGDVVQCGANSTLGITFIDGSVFGLGSNAKMVLNEMVYDPNGSNNSSLMSLVAGTISFVAGATAKHGDMKVDTPVATMGIRGTAVLVEIDFEVTVPGSAPPARFQVLVEPDGTTGSYVLLDRVTLAPIANVNQAGTVTTVSGQGTVSFLSSAQLSPEAMKLISEVFSQRFTDNTNPKSDTHFTDTVIPQNTFPVKFADGGQGTATITVTAAQDKAPAPTTLSSPKDHIPGAPETVTFSKLLDERLDLTHSQQTDTISGGVSYADTNAGDVPTVSTAFNHFTYHNAAGQDVTAALSTAQKNAIAAVSVPLTVVQDPAAKNFGTATWTYNVPDHALDFLAEGEKLTLTYMARVDNNFALNNEFSLVPFTITITGTNDKPTIVADHTTATGGVIEDSHINEAGNLTAGGTVTFNDVDLTDTHTATFVLKSSDASADLPGFAEGVGPGAAHIGTFALVPISEAPGDGDTTGTIGWTFTLDDDDPVLQSLAEGQTITQIYTITVSDGHGGTVTQDVTITITGSNDSPNHPPVIVGELTDAVGAVTEDVGQNASNQIADNGVITFRDIDLIDTHTADFVQKSSHSDLPGFTNNTTYIGTFSLDDSVTEDPTDTNNIGSVGWHFTLDDADPTLQSLAVGETITQVYTVTITDDHGASVDQDVTVTITGTNDIPVVYTTNNWFFEKSDSTGSHDDDTTSGTVSFTDVDLIDTHKVTVKGVVASGVTTGAPDNGTMFDWLSLGTLKDSTGGVTGSTTWTFTAQDHYFDYLADGEQLVLTYTVRVDDHHEGVVDKLVTVTVKGTNDAPELAVDTSGDDGLHAIAEKPGATDSSYGHTASGSLTFTDVDLSDTHTVDKSAPVFNWVNSYGQTLSTTQISTLTAATFTLTPHDSMGTGHGSIDFTYSAKDYYFDFLAEGETLTITYDVTVEDEHHVTSTQPVTITVTGANDAPVAVADVDSGHIVEAGQDANNQAVPGKATTTGNVLDNDTDVDLTDSHEVVGVAAGAADDDLSGGVNTQIKGIYGTLVLKADGSWTYTLDNDDPDTNALPQGAQVSDIFSYTQSDHHGGTATTTLTINITGTNDEPVANAAPAAVSDVNEGLPIVEAGVNPGNTAFPGLATANGNVLTNDYDVDTGDTKTVQGVAIGTPTSPLTGQVGTSVDGTYGTLTIGSNGDWTYTLHNEWAATQALKQGEHVSDIFTYTMRDKLGSTSSATLSIDVTGTNDAPTVASALTNAADEGSASFARDLLDGAADVDHSATLSVTGVTYKVGNGAPSGAAPAGVSLVGHTLTVDPSNPAFDHLAQGAKLVITVSYNVTDELGATVPQTETITITGTNDIPTVTAALTNTAAEGSASFTRDLLDGASDPDDGETATLAVTGVSYSVNNGTASATAPAGVSLSGHTLTVDPTNAAFNHLAVGTSTTIKVSYNVIDAHGATVPQTETITITGTNDIPSVTAALTNTAAEGSASFARNLLDGASDPDDGETATLAVTAVTYSVNNGTASATAPAGVSLAGHTLTVDPSNAAFNHLAEGASTTIKVSYNVIDAQGATVPQTETITITGTNDIPTVTAALTDTAAEGSNSFTRNLLDGASDPDDGETATLAVTSVTYSVNDGTASATAPAGVSLSGHTLTVNPANSAFDYLAVGQSATIKIGYDVTDVHGAKVHQTETVTITGTNDAPSIVGETNPPTHGVMVVNPLSPNVEDPGQNTNTIGLVTEDFNSKTAGEASNNGTGTGNFSSSLLGATFTASGHAGIVLGSSSVSAAPFMGPLPGSVDTTKYLSIGAGATETITFDSAKNAFGLYWGSVDDYNTIKFYNGTTLVASYTGADISPLLATGNQGSFAANGYVDFVGLPFFTKVVLGSTSNAFEIDNISAGVVPTSHAKLVGTVSGTMSVHDPDIGDTLTGLVTQKASVLYNNSSDLPSGVSVGDLIKATNITFDSVQSDGGTDILHWSFDPHGANLDFLKAGDVLKLTYTAQVSDGHGSTGSQQLVVTLVGTDNETNVSSFKFVDGTSGNDTFSNVGGGATVYGNGGNDNFVFKPGSGSATIADFDPATDTITFASSMFNHNPANVLAATNDDHHGNTVITLNATDTITLQHVVKAQLSAADFHFV